jgi:hypothetical protein
MKGLVKIKSSHELYAKNHAKIVAAGRDVDHGPWSTPAVNKKYFPLPPHII